MTERVTISVPLQSLTPMQRCTINGYDCEVLRQAGRTTYLRVLDSRLPGRAVVQLPKRWLSGQPRMVYVDAPPITSPHPSTTGSPGHPLDDSATVAG